MLLFLVIWPQCSLGAEEAITVSPTRVDELVSGGEVITRSIKITNVSETTKKIYAYLRDFTAEGEEGRPRLIIPGTEQGSFLSSWISMQKTSYDFLPNQQQEFTFTIRIPKDTGPGGYYGAVVFGTNPPELRPDSGDKGAAIGISQQAASLILLQIAGDAQESATIRDFTADKQIYGTPYEVKFQTRIENEGNVHLKPRGSIEISNMFGRKIETLMVNEQNANVLPKSIRKYENSWQGNVGFGRYRAALSLSYGTPVGQGGAGMQSLNATTYVWVLPGKIMLIGGAVLAVLFLLFYFFLRTYKQKAIKRAIREMGGSRDHLPRNRHHAPSHSGLITLIVVLILILIGAAIFFLFFA
ncbi:MAG: hypothetical protein WCK11_03515 [Candidatus Falkowbacteria bacterium]